MTRGKTKEFKHMKMGWKLLMRKTAFWPQMTNYQTTGGELFHDIHILMHLIPSNHLMIGFSKSWKYLSQTNNKSMINLPSPTKNHTSIDQKQASSNKHEIGLNYSEWLNSNFSLNDQSDNLNQIIQKNYE